MSDKLLEVKDLKVQFKDECILDSISFTLKRGEIVGLVGNSGSGKSLLSRLILGLENWAVLGPGSLIKFQSDKLGEIELTDWSDSKIHKIRGAEISMIFQEAKVALNPAHSCGFQVKEAVEKHLNITGAKSVTKTLELLRQVDLPDRIFDAYPFQISGGEAQRVMIAMATAGKPQLLIADEPTTSLDPLNEQTIIENLQQINQETGMTILLISHDEELLNRVANRVLYLENGHLLDKKVRIEKDLNKKNVATSKRDLTTPILTVDSLLVNSIGDRKLSRPILDNITFEVFKGEILGVVGNSGSGKTTLARCILQLLKDYKGTVNFKGNILGELGKKSLRQIRREIQIIFQDPLDALNPRMKIGDLLLEVLKVQKIGTDKISKKRLIEDMLEKVHLSVDKTDRYPHQLSGGERQRVCIARVLLLNPSLLILDEPVTSLDSSVRFEVLDLLLKLKEEFNLTYIFISHDLRLINFMSDRVLVMKEGSIIEEGSVSSIFDNPTHEYTKALLHKN